MKDDAGNYVDLSGIQRARWWLGKSAKATGADVYLKKDSNSTMVCDDGVTRNQVEWEAFETDKWRLVVHLKGADTETGVSPIPKTGASYYHEAEIVDADGNIATVSTGSAELVASIVRNL
ncbi:hypothetical protein XH93_18055 [Bradyrhizobium sp. CCBAU 51753]|nr:hypothetical protein XH93_18055 [Bradyrhizobium sp. CCBAU 51753]